MEENNEQKVNTEELKSEASNTVNQVKDTIKNVNIKKDTVETKGFIGDIFKDPLGTMQDYLNTTCIKEAKNEKIKECQIYENIIKDYETLNKKVIEIKEKSDNSKQYATSSLMDNYISAYIKHLWMLNKTIEK